MTLQDSNVPRGDRLIHRVGGLKDARDLLYSAGPALDRVAPRMWWRGRFGGHERAAATSGPCCNGIPRTTSTPIELRERPRRSRPRFLPSRQARHGSPPCVPSRHAGRLPRSARRGGLVPRRTSRRPARLPGSVDLPASRRMAPVSSCPCWLGPPARGEFGCVSRRSWDNGKVA